MADDASRLERAITAITHRVLRWSDDNLITGVRSMVGILFMAGGVLGFLPVLGFWMFPLGVAFVALDIPPMRKRIDLWMESLLEKAKGE